MTGQVRDIDLSYTSKTVQPLVEGSNCMLSLSKWTFVMFQLFVVVVWDILWAGEILLYDEYASSYNCYEL